MSNLKEGNIQLLDKVEIKTRRELPTLIGVDLSSGSCRQSRLRSGRGRVLDVTVAFDDEYSLLLIRLVNDWLVELLLDLQIVVVIVVFLVIILLPIVVIIIIIIVVIIVVVFVVFLSFLLRSNRILSLD